MDKKYLDLLDSIQAAANLALAITMYCTDEKKKEIADRYVEDLQKEIWRTRVSLSEVLKLFPELKENEDESIRKWIIDDIRYNMNNEPLNNSEYKKKAEKAIDWLDKQGEHTDKIQQNEVHDSYRYPRVPADLP